MDIAHIQKYKDIALASRKKCLELVHKAGTSHIGSLMGATDIFAVLFEKINLEKDKFLLSAGWKACLLYYHLWRKGKITLEELDSYCQPGSRFIGLSEPLGIPGAEFAGGSMGLGISGAVGFALAKKLNKEKGKIYCLESDGGMNVGINWEAIAIAAHHRLDNLVLIIENNGFQAMGQTCGILKMDLPEQLKAFGWEVRKCDGHNHKQIERAIQFPPLFRDKPIVIIANTTKGKGISFMENDNNWHYLKVDDKDYELALKELNG